jgi:hypothetical protein
MDIIGVNSKSRQEKEMGCRPAEINWENNHEKKKETFDILCQSDISPFFRLAEIG